MQNIEVSEKSGHIMVTNVDYVSATLLTQSVSNGWPLGLQKE